MAQQLYQPPIEITKEQLKSVKGPGYVMFYAHWCPHCINKVDAWKKLHASQKKQHIYAIDCAMEENAAVCTENGVMGYPTVKKLDSKGKLSESSFSEALGQKGGASRRLSKRKSPKRKSPKRKSPKRRSLKRR